MFPIGSTATVSSSTGTLRHHFKIGTAVQVLDPEVPHAADFAAAVFGVVPARMIEKDERDLRYVVALDGTDLVQIVETSDLAAS